MGIIERFKKRRALKAYVKVLPPLLKKRYGRHKKYTKGQIQRTVEASGLNEKYLYYAWAMYASRDNFEKLSESMNLPGDYDKLRQEIADSHFEGDVGFTIHDALESAETSTGIFGGDRVFDGSGTDVDDGGNTSRTDVDSLLLNRDKYGRLCRMRN
jgi:hypothetical protein